MWKSPRDMAAVLLLATAVIHGSLVPEHFSESPILGALFAVDVLLCLLAVRGLQGDSFERGWLLGLVTCVGALVMYVEMRVIGIPGFRETEWIEPMAFPVVLLEVGYIAVFLQGLRERRVAGRV